MRTIEDLQKIAAAGAGFTIDGMASSTYELQTIVAAGKERVPLIRITNCQERSTQELMEIAGSGGNCVFFVDL